MLAVDGDERPTIEEIRNHPWMQKPFSMRMARSDLLTQWQKKQRKEKKVRQLKKQKDDSGDIQPQDKAFRAAKQFIDES